jgi:hypothetical protein
MKIRLEDLKKMIFEVAVYDTEMYMTTDATRLSQDSVDDQIDSYVLKAETESLPEEGEPDATITVDVESSDELPGDVELDESLKRCSLSLFTEQDAPEAEEDKLSGSEDMDIEEPAQEKKIPNIDIDAFTKKVARLAMNSADLLDIKSVVINRAINFVRENYDEAHVDEMKEILETNFDFDTGDEPDFPSAPAAAGAGVGGGSMGGGGAVV